MAEKLGSPWVFVGVGLLGIAIGAAIILSVTGVLPVQGRLQPGVTNWIVICAGIVFAGIGGVFALTGNFGMCLTYSVDLQSERFDDRSPKCNIGCEGPPEFFGV